MSSTNSEYDMSLSSRGPGFGCGQGMHRDDCHGQGSVGGSAFGLIADRVGIRRIFEAQTVGDREQNISKPSTNSHTAHWHTSIEDEGKEVSL